jgi:hypothetical protein
MVDAGALDGILREAGMNESQLRRDANDFSAFRPYAVLTGQVNRNFRPLRHGQQPSRKESTDDADIDARKKEGPKTGFLSSMHRKMQGFLKRNNPSKSATPAKN